MKRIIDMVKEDFESVLLGFEVINLDTLRDIKLELGDLIYDREFEEEFKLSKEELEVYVNKLDNTMTNFEVLTIKEEIDLIIDNEDNSYFEKVNELETIKDMFPQHTSMVEKGLVELEFLEDSLDLRDDMNIQLEKEFLNNNTEKMIDRLKEYSFCSYSNIYSLDNFLSKYEGELKFVPHYSNNRLSIITLVRGGRDLGSFSTENPLDIDVKVLENYLNIDTEVFVNLEHYVYLNKRKEYINLLDLTEEQVNYKYIHLMDRDTFSPQFVRYPKIDVQDMINKEFISKRNSILELGNCDYSIDKLEETFINFNEFYDFCIKG